MILLERLARRAAKLLPPQLAAQIDYFSKNHEAFFTFGGAMNGQTARLEVVREIIVECGVERIVETGTFRGTTTAWFAQFGTPVHTVEINPRFFSFAQRRLRKWQNVEVKLQSSVAYLLDLAASIANKMAPVLFYLDAHWQDHLPLRDEVEVIFAAFPFAIVAIDDFAVPGDPGYLFDDFGPGNAITLEYLATCRTPPLQIFFPATPSRFETGNRRGCAIATADHHLSAKLARLPLLSHWGVSQL